MAKILVVTDLHNTLVFSTKAWITAFSSISDSNPQEIERRLINKESRHTIAKSLGVPYEEVYAEYRRILKPNLKAIYALRELSVCNIPIVVVSSAPRHRVEDDLKNLEGLLKIDKAYSREHFSKNCQDDWEKLIKLYDCDMILYFGNDPEEDRICHQKVLSVILNE